MRVQSVPRNTSCLCRMLKKTCSLHPVDGPKMDGKLELKTRLRLLLVLSSETMLAIILLGEGSLISLRTRTIVFIEMILRHDKLKK